ncbi:hypothetical protein C7N43_23650, partial [Sphingobacteriales bacterium UPWRP_1]
NNETIAIIGSTTGMPLTVQLNKSNYNGYGISCNGSADGWVVAMPAGGSPPYNLIWNNGLGGNGVVTNDGLNSGTYNVTVSDTQGCLAIATPMTLNEPSQLICSATITNATCSGFSNGSISISASGGVPPYSYSIDDGPGGSQTSIVPSFSNLPQGTYTVSAIDANGCVCTKVLVIEDNIPPVALCKPATVSLGASGTGTASVLSVNNNSTDNCGIMSLTLSQSLFNCSEVGVNTETLTVTDTNGNTATCAALITVQDNIAPVAMCQPATVQLGASGTATVTAAQINNGSTDNCGIGVLTVSPSTFTCANTGVNTVVLTVTDVNGKTASCSASVTVQDNVAPVATCKNATVFLNAAGTATVTTAQVNNGTADNCGTLTYSVSPGNFTCANLGNNTVTLTATDASGVTSSCTATVTVADNIAPSALCKNATVVLSATGTGTLNVSQINNGSTDNCGTITTTLSKTSFNCSNAGFNTVTMTVTDGSNNSASCSATVTVVDNVAPVASCKNATVTLSAAGTATLTPVQVNNGSSDNCGTVNLVSVAPNSFSCSNIGNNTVTLTVNDGNGNTATCMATVTVTDNIVPTALCKNASVTLSATGTASITTAQINNGSTDNCGTVSVSLNNTNFTCANIGANTVVLTATDASNNTATCSATVTVTDNTAPVAVCQNITVTLSGGVATVTPAQVNGGSTDNCGVVNLVSVSPNAFNCSNIGNNTVTLSVNDGKGNTANCQATVTVGPALAATAGSNSPVCFGGTINLTASGGVSYSWSGPGSFTSTAQNPVRTGASLTMAGTYTVTVTNASGCSSVANTVVSVVGSTTASISGNNSFCTGGTINLTASSGTSYSWAGPNGFASTNAGISLSPVTAAMAGTYTVTVSNGGGCTASASKTITVSASPTVVVSGSSSLCAGSTITLTATGGSTYVWLGPDGYTASGSTITRSASTVAMGGIYTVTVTNAAGCTATATRNVTVNPLPVATAGSNSPICAGSTINLTASGGTSYAWSGPNLFSSTLQNPIRTNATTSMAGTYTVTVTGAGGCTATASTTVTVNSPPTLATVSGSSALCAGGTINLLASGGTAYVWSGPNGFTGTGSSVSITGATTAASGIYYVTVSNAAGCSTVKSRTVTVNANPVATAGSNSPVCAGNNLNLTSSGGTSYSWNGPNGYSASIQNPVRTGSTTAMSGIYTVTVTGTGGCTATANTSVSVTTCGGSALVVQSYSITQNSSTTSLGNGSVTLNVTGGVPCSGTSAYNYAWSPATGILTATGTTATYSYLIGGTYTVTITDCGGNSIVQTYVVPETSRGFGFKTDESPFDGLSAAPNPTSGYANVSFTSLKAEEMKLSVYTTEGKAVMELFNSMTEPDVEYNYLLDTNPLPPGIYYLVLESASGAKDQLRLMVVR